MLIDRFEVEQSLSFKIGGVKVSPQIDINQIYSRSDLNCPGIFKVWDFPSFVTVDGKRLNLVFRRMPNLHWKLTEEGDFNHLALIFKKKIFVSLDVEKTLERLLSDCAQITCRRLAEYAAPVVGKDKLLVDSFLSNLNEFESLTTIDGETMSLNVMRHLPTDRLFCLTNSNRNGSDELVGVEQWDESKLSEEFVSKNMHQKECALEKIFKCKVVNQ